MSKLIAFFFILFLGPACFAQNKWSVGIALEKNFTSTIKRPSPNREYEANELAFLDTCNIPFITNSIRFSLERQLWKIFYLKTGFRVGRKGNLSCRDLQANYNSSTGTYSYQSFYSYYPGIAISTPILLGINQKFFKQKLILCLYAGFEFNYKTRKGYFGINNSGHTLLQSVSSGFWGFKPKKEMNPNTPIYGYATRTGPQYCFEFIIKYKIFPKLFFTANLIYLTSPDFQSAVESTYYGYFYLDRKLYTASLGVGLSYCF
jgi:hypothetical protein